MLSYHLFHITFPLFRKRSEIKYNQCLILPSRRPAPRVNCFLKNMAASRPLQKREITISSPRPISPRRPHNRQDQVHYPRHTILAEESGQTAVVDGDTKWKWIVDPLDGTTNFAHSYPCFCVTIALEHENELVIGVTYDPTRNELFTAEKGRERVSIQTDSCLVDRQAERIARSSPVFLTTLRRRAISRGICTRFCLAARGVRRDGSAAIDLAYIACGRL